MSKSKAGFSFLNKIRVLGLLVIASLFIKFSSLLLMRIGLDIISIRCVFCNIPMKSFTSSSHRGRAGVEVEVELTP